VLPVEPARRLWNPAILAADPQLGRMWNLDTAWMNGIMFFLREHDHPTIRPSGASWGTSTRHG
jgi:hypothetical protein